MSTRGEVVGRVRRFGQLGSGIALKRLDFPCPYAGDSHDVVNPLKWRRIRKAESYVQGASRRRECGCADGQTIEKVEQRSSSSSRSHQVRVHRTATTANGRRNRG